MKKTCYQTITYKYDSISHKEYIDILKKVNRGVKTGLFIEYHTEMQDRGFKLIRKTQVPYVSATITCVLPKQIKEQK